jgi:hypothetical protein
LRFDKLCFLAFGLAACLDATDPSAPQPVSSLKISTSAGIQPFAPGVRGSFTENLLELVFEPGPRHLGKIDRNGSRYRLSVRQASPHPADVLAAALRHERLETASAEKGEVIAEVRAGPDLEIADLWLDVGPYVQESYDASRIVLRRRAPGNGPQRIEIIHVASEEEEWRRFLGREVDLVPIISPGMARYLREVPSVKLVEMEERPAVALYFRVASEVFQSTETRRAVAQLLRRGAIASVAIGDASAAYQHPGAEAGRVMALGKTLRLVFHDANVQHGRAALVVEQQLIEMGFQVELAALGIDDLIEATSRGTFDALLFFGGLGAEQLGHLRTGHPGNIAGYSSAAYDRLLDAGNLSEARARAVEDAPFTLLYAVRAAVAVDARWCNVQPKSPGQLTWLADVRPCGPGESE